MNKDYESELEALEQDYEDGIIDYEEYIREYERIVAEMNS